jgi:subfamily B ATP-binding cassette protein MsbA
MEAFELARFRAALVRMFRADARALRVVALTGPFLELVGAVLGAALFWYAGLKHLPRHPGRTGFLLLPAGHGVSLLVSLKGARSRLMNNDLQQAVAAASRVFEMMDMENDIVEAPDALELRPFFQRGALRSGSVRLRRSGRARRDRTSSRAPARCTPMVGSSGRGRPARQPSSRASTYRDGRQRDHRRRWYVARATLASLRRQARAA